MRAITATVNPTTTQAMIRMDNFATAVLAGAIFVSGGAAFALVHSDDDPNDLVNPVPAASMAWDNSLLPLAAQSGAASVTFQVMASPLWFQLKLTNGVGSVRATFLQVGTHSHSNISKGPSAPLFALPGSPVGVYSTRNIVTGYASSCMLVRRSSDNTTLAIGFDPTTKMFDGASALAFAAGSTLWVQTWYDQSGSGLNVTQATVSSQPQLIQIGPNWWVSYGNGQYLVAASVGALALTGDQTIGCVMQLNSDNGQMVIACTDSSNGWTFWPNGVASGGVVGPNPKKFTYFTFGATINDPTSLMAQMPSRIVLTRTAGAVKNYINGVNTSSGAASNGASGAPFQISGYSGANPAYCEGLIGEVFLYSSALTPTQLATIDASEASTFPSTGFAMPYSGTAAVQFGLNEYINFGNVLAYERTQPWTVFAAIQMYGMAPGNPGATVVHTNVPGSGSAYPGYENWIDQNGHWRVRITSNIGTLNYLSVIGSTNLADGKKHMVAVTYDGSSSVAGVKVYIDGVAETLATEQNTLTASIIGAGQSYYIGNQQGILGYNLRGMLSFFQLDNLVRSQGYISAYINGAIPPNDGANTAMRLLLNEGTGTTINDTASVPHNGVLTSATMWVP
jgi:hypothetical protein